VTLADKTILVTGANRGIGQALVEEALNRGAKRVYAGVRRSFTHTDERVRPLALDVTKPAQIQAAAEQVESLDVLINNAGIATSCRCTPSPPLPLIPAYSISKAAAFSLTQSQRALVAGRACGFTPS
jgi:NAD(P)-dependent dehydrogenase (short-subunit alcohol dehydrogenase family)